MVAQLWEQIGSGGQLAVAAALAGLVAWGLQRLATDYQGIAWLTKATAKWSQIGVAASLAVITAVVACLATGDWSKFVEIAGGAYATGQVVHNLSK